MKHNVRDQMQGAQDYVVVDEVDSILIDEARTPLIISGPAHDDVSNYRVADNIARMLITRQQQANREMAGRLDELEKTAPPDVQSNAKFKDGIKKFRTDPFWLSSDEGEAIGHMQYFVVELDHKSAHMTEHGAKAAQAELAIGSFYDSKNMNWPHYIDNALRAHLAYQEGQGIRRPGRPDHHRRQLHRPTHARPAVVGRAPPGGRGQEKVTIKQETQTLATITLQNLFKLYKQLAGMTGTAMTEADEFMKIYKLEVIAIPTNRPVRRIDFNDKIYRTVANKFDALVEEIRAYSQKGFPADPWSLQDILSSPATRCVRSSPRTMAVRALCQGDGSDSAVGGNGDVTAQVAKIDAALAAFADGNGDERPSNRATAS